MVISATSDFVVVSLTFQKINPFESFQSKVIASGSLILIRKTEVKERIKTLTERGVMPRPSAALCDLSL